MRALFTTLPGDGHVNPLVPLARALIAAGHEVAFACAPRFRPTIEARGFRAFPVGLDWTIGKGGPAWAELWPKLRTVPPEHVNDFVVGRMFAGDAAERALPDLLTLARAWSPDVIVRETWEFGGWLTAETLGLPHASIEVTPAAFFAEYQDVAAASLAGILQRSGRPARDVLARLFAHLHLAFVPPSFEDPAIPRPATTHHLRPALLDPLPGEQTPPWLAALPDRPTVYATGGTAGGRNELFGPLLTGVRELDVNLIATIGEGADPAEFGPQPDNVHIAGYISQALVLPRCAAVVTHGGFSSVLGALACGVPLVISPNGADRPLNARRAAALGTAIVVEVEQRTPEVFRTAVRKVLTDPAYRQSARRVQAEIDSLPGPERGVTLLEQLVARHAPAMIA